MMGLFIAILGYGFVISIIVYEGCKRKREVSKIIARIKARDCRIVRVVGDRP